MVNIRLAGLADAVRPVCISSTTGFSSEKVGLEGVGVNTLEEREPSLAGGGKECGRSAAAVNPTTARE